MTTLDMTKTTSASKVDASANAISTPRAPLETVADDGNQTPEETARKKAADIARKNKPATKEDGGEEALLAMFLDGNKSSEEDAPEKLRGQKETLSKFPRKAKPEEKKQVGVTKMK